MRHAGMGLVVAAALVAGTTLGAGGCSSGNKQQQQQAKMEKQRQKEAMARAKEEARQLKMQQQQVAHEIVVQQAQAEVAAHNQANLGPTLLTTSHATVPPQPTGYADDRFDVVGSPLIRPENQQHQIDKFDKAMAAAGAKHEAMLHDQDFDGPALSEIGLVKIALMAQNAKPNQPLTIYVPGRAGAEEQTQARLAAVQEYWRSSPYAAIPLQVKDGINPGVVVPAQQGLTQLKNLEKQQNSSGNNDGTANANGTSSSSGSSSGTTNTTPNTGNP